MAPDSFADFITSWDFYSPLSVLLLIAAGGYTIGLVRLQRRSDGQAVSRKRVAYAVAGLALSAFALTGPLDAYAGRAFMVHMTQHLVLTMAAAPLLLAASPVAAYMWALPEQIRLGVGQSLSRQGLLRKVAAFFVKPPVALLVFVLTFYVWHMPVAYEAALNNSAVHFIQHVTMFGSSIAFWWPIIGPAPLRSELSYPQRMLYMLLVVTPKALLGAVLTFAGHPLYEHYIAAPDLWGVSDAEDQTISGLLMWLPGNAVFLGALTVLFFKWYKKETGHL